MPIPPGARPFDVLAGELLADELTAEPVQGSVLGLTEYDELLPDLREDAIETREAREDSWSDRLSALDDDALAPAEQVDRDLVLMVLEGRRTMRTWQRWRRSADLYAGQALSGLHVLLTHRLRPEPELAKALAARLRAVPEVVAAGMANLDPALASPDLLRRALGQVRAGAAYARSIAGELADEGLRGEVAEAGEVAAAALERFGAHVEDLAGRATGGWAIGEERYDALLRHAEGLPYGAREMRERGAAAYAELEAEMRRRARDLGGDDDWRTLLRRLAEDRPGTPEEMLAAYTEATAAAREFVRAHDLVTLPRGEECAVVPSAPFTRSMLAVAHYLSPPPFADRRTGHFFVPYPPDGAAPQDVEQRLATNAHALLWSIATHEAYPGHHWHLARIAEVGGRPLRYVFSSTYFTEGWGLYAEELMREHGFFPDAARELGQVQARLFRAARVVVDTSLHLGEMTVDEATDHLVERAGLSHGTARAEVLRYCAWPTQAASYLTGALEIARLRDEWLHQARGSLKDFHDTVAATGRLPISLVERSLAVG